MDIADINKLTDEELDKLLESEELKCKIDPKTSEIKCLTTEEYFQALSRLKKPVKRVVFEVTSEAPVVEPVKLS